MAITLKEAVKRSFLFDVIRPFKQRLDLRRWERMGRPVPPPPQIKQAIVRDYARRFGTAVLIETGTYLGDMIHAMRNDFRRIVSIELDGALYRRAARRFCSQPHVQILHGDSGEKIRSVLDPLTEPALFWLDAHYSGGITARAAVDTPIVKELEPIMAHGVRGHVVLIDDARAFNGTNNYPTLDALREVVAQRRPDWTMTVEQDVIRLHPR